MRISDWSSDVCSSDLVEALVFVRAGDGRGVELVDLEAQQVDLAGARPLVTAEGGELLVDPPHIASCGGEAGAVDVAEAVEGGALDRRAQQGLVGVLRVEVDEALAPLLELGDGGQAADRKSTRQNSSN